MSEASVLPVEIHQGQDFYVPSFLIKVGAKELREVNDVQRLAYSDSLEQIDSFELTLNNWNDKTFGAQTFSDTSFKYSDGPLLDPWQDVEVWVGYLRYGNDERRRMLTGEITTLTPTFPSSGVSTVTVRGLNLFHRFRTEQATRPFFNKTDTEIAQLLVDEIAEEVKKRVPGLELVLDPEDVARNREREEKHEYLLMSNQYPIVFLMQRARRIGYELTMEEDPTSDTRKVIFHYGSTSLISRPTYILEWGKTLLSFQPTLQTANQVSEVTVRGWSPQSKDKIEATATRQKLVDEKLIAPSDIDLAEPELAQKLEIVVDRPIRSQAEADELALKTLRKIGETLITAQGKTIGVPDLRAGSKIELRGLGRRFSGTYLVTATTHNLGEGGYTTDFEARMERT